MDRRDILENIPRSRSFELLHILDGRNDQSQSLWRHLHHNFSFIFFLLSNFFLYHLQCKKLLLINSIFKSFHVWIWIVYQFAKKFSPVHPWEKNAQTNERLLFIPVESFGCFQKLNSVVSNEVGRGEVYVCVYYAYRKNNRRATKAKTFLPATTRPGIRYQFVTQKFSLSQLKNTSSSGSIRRVMPEPQTFRLRHKNAFTSDLWNAIYIFLLDKYFFVQLYK